MKNIGGRGHAQLSRLETPENTSRIHFSFQPLARCPSRNSFLLITIHFHGGCTRLAHDGRSLTAGFSRAYQNWISGVCDCRGLALFSGASFAPRSKRVAPLSALVL